LVTAKWSVVSTAAALLRTAGACSCGGWITGSAYSIDWLLACFTDYRNPNGIEHDVRSLLTKRDSATTAVMSTSSRAATAPLSVGYSLDPSEHANNERTSVAMRGTLGTPTRQERGKGQLHCLSSEVADERVLS